MSGIGDAPIDPEYQEKMVTMAYALDDYFNSPVKGAARQTGFVLLVFPFGEKEGRCNYISNGAGRDDIVKLFEEQIKRFKGEAK